MRCWAGASWKARGETSIVKLNLLVGGEAEEEQAEGEEQSSDAERLRLSIMVLEGAVWVGGLLPIDV